MGLTGENVFGGRVENRYFRRVFPSLRPQENTCWSTRFKTTFRTPTKRRTQRGRGGGGTLVACVHCVFVVTAVYILLGSSASGCQNTDVTQLPPPRIRVRYILQAIAGYNCLELNGGDDTPTLPVRRDANPPHRGQPQMFF